jgi:hypothetical protein
MQQPVKERIVTLRQEIAEIRETNRVYLQGGERPGTASDHERRMQRLQEILDELMSLTDWKKFWPGMGTKPKQKSVSPFTKRHVYFSPTWPADLADEERFIAQVVPLGNIGQSRAQEPLALSWHAACSRHVSGHE